MNKVTKQIAEELADLAAMPDQAIDTSDIPETRSLEGAEVGRFYRPPQEPVNLRVDADVMDWFKKREPKYEAAINRALREYMLNNS